jgi:hypothetical protein
MMNRVRYFAALGAAALGLAAGSAQAQYVSGSVSGQLAPGVYGQVNIGNGPPPALLYAQPMVIAPQPAYVPAPPPVYMYVPPGHAKHWRKHCAQYGMCGRPVYFVRNPPPRYYEREHRREWERGRGGWDDDRGHGHDHGHGRGHRKHGHD